MIRIDFQEPDTERWRKWRAECEEEQERHNRAIEGGEQSKVEEDIYKGKKYNIKPNVYMNLDGPFHGKCTFCESLIAENHPGDIEHFRPKNRVTDAKNKPIVINTEDGLKPHPGYYWLAYDWTNLLPACIDCNRPSKDKSGGKRIGKWDQFPLKSEGSRAARQGEEEREKPLLINPVFDDDDPEEHLEVDETGTIHPKNKSHRGQACIDIFGLNLREALVESRRGTYKQTSDLVGLVMLSVMNRYGDTQDRLNRFWQIWEGHSPHSAAGRAAIKQRLPGDTLELLLRLYRKLTEN